MQEDFKLYGEMSGSTAVKINLTDVIPCEAVLYVMFLYHFNFIPTSEVVMISKIGPKLSVFPAFYSRDTFSRDFSIDHPSGDLSRIEKDLKRAGFSINKATEFSWIISSPSETQEEQP